MIADVLTEYSPKLKILEYRINLKLLPYPFQTLRRLAILISEKGT